MLDGAICSTLLSGHQNDTYSRQMTGRKMASDARFAPLVTFTSLTVKL